MTTPEKAEAEGEFTLIHLDQLDLPGVITEFNSALVLQGE
jgi:hypothetical protein